MLGDYVSERLSLEVFVRHRSGKLVIVPSFVAKYCCSVFLRKNGSLGEI